MPVNSAKLQTNCFLWIRDAEVKRCIYIWKGIFFTKNESFKHLESGGVSHSK